MIEPCAYLTAKTFYLPTNVLSNEMINKNHPEWTVEKIAAKTGVYNRFIVDKNECSSDLGLKAASKLFQDYNVIKSDIDYLIFCTQTPDYFLPTTACIIQDKLGLKKSIGAIDINLGCSGFVYGLGIAKGLIVSGQAKKVLFITSETYSKIIDPNDKTNKTIFGDAASAVLIESEKREGVLSAEIGNFQYGTDGSGAEFLILKKGGMRFPIGFGENIESLDDDTRKDFFLHMDGKAIFNFTAFEVPPLLKRTAELNHLELNQVDLFVLHQANSYMLQTIRKRADIDEKRFYVNMSCANTVSSTIPIALYQAQEECKIKEGSNVIISGFGVGLSMGCVILRF